MDFKGIVNQSGKEGEKVEASFSKEKKLILKKKKITVEIWHIPLLFSTFNGKLFKDTFRSLKEQKHSNIYKQSNGGLESADSLVTLLIVCLLDSYLTELFI